MGRESKWPWRGCLGPSKVKEERAPEIVDRKGSVAAEVVGPKASGSDKGARGTPGQGGAPPVAPEDTHHRMNRLLMQPVPMAAARLLLNAHARGLMSSCGRSAAESRTLGGSTTFSFLMSKASTEALAPADLQELRSTRRLLEVCTTPAGMMRDITGLKYISRGASCVVFQGLWQCSEVAVKLLVSPSFSPNSSSVREALLGCELAHPNLVQCYAVRCLEVTELFINAARTDLEGGGRDTQSTRVGKAAGAANADTTDFDAWLQRSFDSGDGFGPPPAPPTPPAVLQHAYGVQLHLPHALNSTNGQGIEAAQNITSAMPRQRLHPRKGSFAYLLPAHNPWQHGASWHDVLQALRAAPGQVLTMLVQELCDLGVLSWAIHKKRLFVPVPADPHKLALRALLRTAREVAVGLHHLHEAGVVHGDLKPANVVLMSSRLDRRGFVAKVTDLGLSRVLCADKMPYCNPLFEADDAVDEEQLVTDADWGTTAYMAPEHFKGLLCRASDIFSWGILMWEMAHAQRPHDGLKRDEIMGVVLSGKLMLPWDPLLPPELVRLCSACLAYAPSARPSCHDIITALGDIEAALRDEMRVAALRGNCLYTSPA